MKSQFEKKENSLVELTLELTPEEFQAALKEAYRNQAKRFNVPGFRKGKAPYGIAMRHYGEGVLYDEAIDLALNDAYVEALQEHNIDPVARPELDIQKIGSTEGLTALLKITVVPDVKLGEYKGVEAEKPEAEVSDEAVEEELKRIQSRSGRMVPVEERAAELGDTAHIDFKGFLGEEAFEGGEGQGHDLELGSGSFIPGFEEQVVGHKPGEQFEVQVTFPEQYHAKELAGQAARFEVTLHSLKRKELPELDDEFAKDVSEFDTLAEYRQDLKAKLLERRQKEADAQFEDAVVKAAVDAAEVEIPPVMIEGEIDNRLRQQEQSMAYQGIKLNQYLSYLGKTLAEYREELKPQALNTVKTGLVLEAIAEAEGMEPTEADLDVEYERLSKQYGMEVDELKKHFVQARGQIEAIARSRKVIELLKQEAKAIKPKKKAAKKATKKTAAEEEKAEKKTAKSTAKRTKKAEASEEA